MPLFSNRKKPKYIFRLTDKEAFNWLISDEFYKIINRLEAKTENEAALQQLQNLKALRLAFLRERNAKMFCRTSACILFIAGSIGSVSVLGLDLTHSGGAVSIAVLTTAIVANPNLVSSLTAVTFASTIIGFLPSITNTLLNTFFSYRKNKMEKAVCSIHANMSQPEQVSATIKHLSELNAKLRGYKRNRYIGATVNRALQQIAELNQINTSSSRPPETETVISNKQTRQERHKALIEKFEQISQRGAQISAEREAELDLFITTLQSVNKRNKAQAAKRRADQEAAQTKKDTKAIEPKTNTAVPNQTHEVHTRAVSSRPDPVIFSALSVADLTSAIEAKEATKASQLGLVAQRIQMFEPVKCSERLITYNDPRSIHLTTVARV